MDKGYYDECLQRWDHPTSFDSNSNFAGEKPSGYVIVSKNRDSSILENVNFDEILKALGGESESVYVIRHGHWACGWIEYLMVDDTAPESLLDQCVEIVRALDAYPVFSDTAYSDAVFEAIDDEWSRCGLRDRIDYCNQAEISIFCARRDAIPEEVYDLLTASYY